ncbi:hypothetical protein GCK72_005617 [Caenorhabditis remanei]|uniref:Uncharacterized protein n=1 Tax=Caenorhabditis remanei TaxID=31234 RepID=A0A6A5HG10_CAERE|nr:hypothetical protein GCK72_005617 [Caenorhabditis remanei]KAF1765664.1 hypothetical protein GCK72_005617 [Caenorhabditis remanei]
MYQLQQPFSASHGVFNPHSSDSSSNILDQYWFNPDLNQIVISKLAPSSTSSLVIANIIPGEALPSSKDIYEQFLAQQRDAFIPGYRKDAGTYTSVSKKIERQEYYNNQKPQTTLGKVHHGVTIQNERNPNPRGTMGNSNYSLRKQVWMPIVTPDKFSYTTVALANVSKEGVLHCLIRHGHQFKALSGNNKLKRDVIDILKFGPLRNTAKAIRDKDPKGQTREDRDRDHNIFMNETKKLSDEELEELLKLQWEMRDAIQSIVQQSNYLGETINENGQQRVYWKAGPREVMVICLSEQLYFGEIGADSRGRNRNIRKIITIYIIDSQDFERKKKNSWSVTKTFA